MRVQAYTEAMSVNLCSQKFFKAIYSFKRKVFKAVSEPTEDEITSSLATYAEFFVSGDLSTPEGEKEYDDKIGEISDQVQSFFPDLSHKDFHNLLQNIEHKVVDSHTLLPTPKIKSEHLELVEKAYNLYLQRQLSIRNRLSKENFS